jgi:phospholipid transport system transporter-binding protein
MAAIQGELSFRTAPALLDRAGELTAESALDLSGVSKADSAGVALLLELTRRAKKQGRPLALGGVPSQLRELIRFFDLESALQLKGSA